MVIMQIACAIAAMPERDIYKKCFKSNGKNQKH